MTRALRRRLIVGLLLLAIVLVLTEPPEPPRGEQAKVIKFPQAA